MQITDTVSAVRDERGRRRSVLWFVLLRIPELMLATLIAVLVIFLTGSVIGRYVFDVGIAWSDEAARVMFIWVVYLGFAVGLRHRGNIGVDLLVSRLPAKGRRSVTIFQDLAIFLFSIFFLWQSLTTLRFSFIQRLPAMQISIAWLYAAVVVAAALMTIYGAANLFDSLQSRHDRHADAAGRHAAGHSE